MLSSPVMVSADALFSMECGSSSALSMMNLTEAGKAEMSAKCHMQNLDCSDQQLQNVKTDNAADCCEIPCECGVSGCSTLSVAVDSYTSVFTATSYLPNYPRSHYLSLATSPSSPPPIV